MSGIKKGRPSPSMIVAGAALVVAVTGTAIADPLATTSVLDKKEKKQVRKIARNQINTQAPGLSVANATNATNATNANNANALSNVALGDLNPIVQETDPNCSVLVDFGNDCRGATLTLNRSADVLVMVTGTWHSQDATDTNVQAICRLERNNVSLTPDLSEYGSENDDTDDDNYERAVSIIDIDADRPAGSSNQYALSCDREEGTSITIDSVSTIAIALGS